MSRGAAPSTWDEVDLGEVATLHRGYDLPSGQRRPGAIPVVSSSGITGFHDEPKCLPPGVVTGRYGTLGEVFFVDVPFWPLNTALYVSDFHDNDARFVSYFLQCQGLGSQDGAAAVPGVNRNVLHRMPALRPPLLTQRKIAAILSAYDDLIANHRRRARILEEMMQRIYQGWFTDFKYPGHDRVELVESGLGLCPAGWSVQPISELASVVRGRSYRGAEVVPSGGVPFFNLKCIARDGGFRSEGVKRFQGEYRQQHTVVVGDIVMAVTDMTQERRIVARAARVPASTEPVGVFSMDLVKLVPLNVPSEFLYGLLRYSGFSDEVKAHANGANVLHLNPARISEYQAVVPPPELRDRYATVVAPMYRESDHLHQAVEAMSNTRDFLLPRLVGGKIDVDGLSLTMPADSA